ncbi:AEC family transporter [Halalkalibacter krulwichiae]|uniref:Membrane transport protein n=1 Tax=Halalkalibacter krulwichiae TaxID=199441 RepID=A0A1X9MF82_9BACI|nr:AEC family transporter [Halalkalibacter krulwichiae]ARK31190.1 Membrane transport protein [Halalkalibacter krulwichiae]
MDIFIQVVFPVLLVFLIGFFVQKWKKIDIKAVSTVAIYIMTPSLVFRTFYYSEINLQALYMIIFSILLLFSLIIINKVYAKLKKYDRATESGLILSTAFMNAGNYGAPIILFAYGEEAFAYSVIFLVLQSIIMNCFGVYYAARGKAGVSIAFREVLKMPATYAVILGLLLKVFSYSVPPNLMLTVDIIAEAAIPTVMIILGMQLARIEWGNFEWGKVSYATVVRLLVSPLIAVGITFMLPLDPLIAKVLIVSAAMPSAATIVMYAVQFDAKPKLVSSTTLITTMLSIITITSLLWILG